MLFIGKYPNMYIYEALYIQIDNMVFQQGFRISAKWYLEQRYDTVTLFNNLYHRIKLL